MDWHSHHLWLTVHEIMQILRSCDDRVNKHPRAKKARGSTYKHHLKTKNKLQELWHCQIVKSALAQPHGAVPPMNIAQVSRPAQASECCLPFLPHCLGTVTPCQVLGHDIFPPIWLSRHILRWNSSQQQHSQSSNKMKELQRGCLAPHTSASNPKLDSSEHSEHGLLLQSKDCCWTEQAQETYISSNCKKSSRKVKLP